MKPKLSISFSGGRTSAVMTKLCLERLRDKYDMTVTFANTGCEHPATLEFIRQCDETFGFQTVWLEAVVNPEKGKGVTHKVVSFETSARKGEPFEAAISKFGIPNQTSPFCTDRLKLDVMRSYLRSIGWASYQTAIGIRYDELDRQSRRKEELGLVYPLIGMKVTKEDVKKECLTWPFDLKLPGDHFGNCTFCFKKSLRKHLTLATQDPSCFDFARRMEALHGKTKADRAAGDGKGNRWFFRNHRSVSDLEALAAKGFTPYSDDAITYDPEFDIASSCSESCELFGDDTL